MATNLTSHATIVPNNIPQKIAYILKALPFAIMMPMVEPDACRARRQMDIDFTSIKRIPFGFFLTSD